MDPQYEITDKILNNIVEIESTRQFINYSKITPSYDLLLKNKAIIDSSHNSTSIEGNTLNSEEVQKLFNLNKDNNLPNKISYEEIEVLNYFNLLENLDKYSNNFKQYSRNIILSFHKELTKNILEKSGEFRDTQVIVADSKSGKVNYVPPPAIEVPYLIDEFIEWLNRTDIQLILKCGIAHYELVRIHPFVDGNGRTSRILANFILKVGGFDINKYFTLDEYYNQNRPAYYAALRSVQNTGMLTQWLEYFTTGFLDSINKIKNEIETMIKITNIANEKLELTSKEIEIIKYLESNKHISNNDVQELFNISSKSSYKYLKRLTDKKLIKKLGNGRNTYYELI
ncbi:MAG: Fic family protein [Methanobrevibacter sp.]|nr:Fic family protein [Methanobrevibacter sp.]